MKIPNAIFITVRTGSTRLPKKALLTINGIAVIEHLIRRLKRTRLAEGIVLCTTELPEDDVLCDIAVKNNIYYFRGSLTDKLMRWKGACDAHMVDFFVTADGDDIFCEPELIDLAFEQYVKTKADFIEGKNIPCGAFTYGIKTTALNKVCEIKDSEDTEMMWVYFTQTGLFRTETLENIPVVFKRPEIRMTLDYPDDFTFFKTVIEALEEEKKGLTLREILAYCDRNPQVIKINQHLQEQFLENQRKKTNLKIKGAAR